MATKDTLFTSKKPEDKAQRINDAARAIISAEDDARQAKTERLRAARLAMEAKAAAEAEPEAAPKRKPAARRTKTFKV